MTGALYRGVILWGNGGGLYTTVEERLTDGVMSMVVIRDNTKHMLLLGRNE